MAERDPNFRNDVLELDGYRCVLCGVNGIAEDDRYKLEADHVVERGMGGNPQMDDRANGMTLCKNCHRLKTQEIIKVSHWNRGDEEDGLIVSNNGKEMPKKTIWFYRKKDKDMLERSIEALTLMAASQAQRARILNFVWENYDLSDAQSPQQLVASIGLEPNQAKRDAEAYAKLVKFGLEWPEGANYEKIKLILKPLEGLSALTSEEKAKHEEILLSSVSSSYSDLKATLYPVDASEATTVKETRKNLYIIIKRDEFLKSCSLVMADEGEVALGDDRIVLRVDKLYSPLRRRKNKLYISDNSEIEEELKF